MLLSHLEKELGNWYSQGLYDFQPLEFHNIQDNALFIVRENGNELNRYQYKPVFIDTVKLKMKKEILPPKKEPNSVFRVFLRFSYWGY